MQKRTFTKWVNVYLSLHDPPHVVNDLFDDLKDGTKLLALIEVLSGQPLVSERWRVVEMTSFRFRLARRTWKKTSALPRQYQQCPEVPGKPKGQTSQYSSD